MIWDKWCLNYNKFRNTKYFEPLNSIINPLTPKQFL